MSLLLLLRPTSDVVVIPADPGVVCLAITAPDVTLTVAAPDVTLTLSEDC